MRYLLMALLPLMVSCKAVDKLALKALYPGSRTEVGAAPDGVQDVWLGNNTIHGWVFTTQGAERTIVYLHGNGENIQDIYDYGLIHAIQRLGANVVVIDYPGFGKSKGEQNEETFALSGVHAINFAREKFGGKIVLWGRSIGAAVALQAYKRLEKKPDYLILTSPWTSFQDVAMAKTRIAKSLSPEFLKLHGFDSLAIAPSVDTPTLIHHGDKDTLIPFEQGEKLSKAIPGALFKRMPGKGHNDVFTRELFSDLQEFLK